MNFFLIAVIVLGIVGLVAAVILFGVSKKFAVNEDARIAKVTAALPGANCGSCGFPGCSGFANACVKAADTGSIEGFVCPVGGDEVMNKVADILGMQASAIDRKVAVVRCNGTCDNRPQVVTYDGRKTCANLNACGAGETECGYGCLGCGDCVNACSFDAISMNPLTGLPEVDYDKCSGCGNCAKACPRGIIEIRKRGPKDRRIWVDCVNKDKGPVAKKACSAACIGCSLCVKECKFEAITVVNNVAHIDEDKCRLCRSCVKACPTKAIHEINFPAPRIAAPLETTTVNVNIETKEDNA